MPVLYIKKVYPCGARMNGRGIISTSDANGRIN